MRKNGFTLIELLAVIVILAILALIAIPITVNIVRNARKEGNERSIDLYANAIRNSIFLYEIEKEEEVEPGSYSSSTLPFEVQYEGNIDCSTIEIYEDGKMYIEGCTVKNKTVDYTYGTKQSIIVRLNKICTLAEDSEKTGINIGAKYNCKVDPNKDPYTFYVLSVEGNEVNLIMDSNIRTGGEPVKETSPTSDQIGTVAWYSNEKNNSYGPVTALEYLQEATKDWTNVSVQTINTFTDESGTVHEMDETFVLNARLPYINEVESVGCRNEMGTCPLWMVDYLHNGDYQTNGVANLYGYLLLSSDSSNSEKGWNVSVDAKFFSIDVTVSATRGVRPVIKLIN